MGEGNGILGKGRRWGALDQAKVLQREAAASRQRGLSGHAD